MLVVLFLKKKLSLLLQYPFPLTYYLDIVVVGAVYYSRWRIVARASVDDEVDDRFVFFYK